MGRYQGAPEGVLLLNARDEAGRRWCEAVSGRVSDNPALTRAWARAYVRELEDRFVMETGERTKQEREIVEVSLRFGVLCRFTSFVAVDRSAVVNEGGERHKIVQPVEVPAGWGIPERHLPSPAFAAPMTLACAPPPSMSIPPPDDSVDSCLMMPPEDFEEAEPAGGSHPRKKRKAPPPPAGTPAQRAWRGQALPPMTKLGRGAKSADYPDIARGGTEKAMRDAASPASPEQSGGILSRMFNAVFGRRDKAQVPPAAEPPAGPRQPAPEPIDLSAYRRRAGELVELLTAHASADGSQRQYHLGVVMLKLGALLEDLRSVGAPGDVGQPLEELHAELQQFLMLERYEEAALSLHWAKAELVLRAFAEGASVTASAPGPRQDFWK
jgi:hypothetical protein